jgi:O-antigen/teichoic acid export membrane protein
VINTVEEAVAPAATGSILQNVSRQGVSVLVSRGGLLVLGLASNILLSRILGPTGLGRYQLGYVLVQLVASFCILGLDKSLMRYFPLLETKGIGGRRLLFIQGTGVVVAISAAFSAALLLLAPVLARSYFHSPDMNGVVRMFCLCLPFFALARFLAGATSAIKRADFGSQITNILTPALFLAALVVVAVTQTGVYGAIVGRSVSMLVAAVALLWFLLWHLPKEGDSPGEAGYFKGYLRLSLPLFFVGLGYLLLGQMDTIMLGHFVGERDVGVYSVAVRISAFVLLGLEIILPIVGPFWAQFAETSDLSSTRALFGTVTKWIAQAGLIIFAFIVVFRLELLRVFGKGFEPGATVVWILCLGQLANAVTGPTGQLLSMTGRQRLEVMNTVGMVGVNFFLNLFLIPRFGINGAAIATGLSIASINLIKAMQVYFLYGLQPYTAKYLKGGVAVASASLTCYLARVLLSQHGSGPYVILLLGGGTFVLIAAVIFWALGLDEDDRVALLALRKRRVQAVTTSEAGSPG